MKIRLEFGKNNGILLQIYEKTICDNSFIILQLYEGNPAKNGGHGEEVLWETGEKRYKKRSLDNKGKEAEERRRGEEANFS